jgi:hypothetical protein
MPTSKAHDEANLPLLRLTHDGGFPDARQTGRIIERLGSAFSQHSRLGGGDCAADLSIQYIQIGSLLVDFKDILETGTAILSVYEHRELLGGFVAQLSDAVGLMRGRQQPLPMYRTALEALSAPVTTGRASAVTLQVIGDNNNILIVDREVADEIAKYLRAQPKPLRQESLREIPAKRRRRK